MKRNLELISFKRDDVEAGEAENRTTGGKRALNTIIRPSTPPPPPPVTQIVSIGNFFLHFFTDLLKWD